MNTQTAARSSRAQQIETATKARGESEISPVNPRIDSRDVGGVSSFGKFAAVESKGSSHEAPERALIGFFESLEESISAGLHSGLAASPHA